MRVSIHRGELVFYHLAVLTLSSREIREGDLSTIAGQLLFTFAIFSFFSMLFFSIKNMYNLIRDF